MTSAFSWQNSVILCPASCCTPRPNLSVILGIFWLPIFEFQSPMMKKTFFWCEDGDCSHEIKRRLLLRRKAMNNVESILKSRDITLPTKVRVVKAMVFPVVMYGCESWTVKKAEHRRIDAFALVLEKPFESPLDCKEIKPVNPKGNQSWMFIGRTDVEAEAPILWPPDAKNWLIGKDLNVGKDWRQEEKRTTEDEMVG